MAVPVAVGLAAGELVTTGEPVAAGEPVASGEPVTLGEPVATGEALGVTSGAALDVAVGGPGVGVSVTRASVSGEKVGELTPVGVIVGVGEPLGKY